MLGQDWRCHRVVLGQHSYPYFSGHDCSDRIVRALAGYGTDRFFVVTDDTVQALHGDDLLPALGRHAPVHVLSQPPGEGMKSLASLSSYLEAAIAAGATRRSLVVAFGGGVPGNLAGALAGLLYRGVRLVHVPTTTVAAMDSVISLKQAVNSSHGKNHIGIYHIPEAVYLDVRLLQTLPDRELRSGLCEKPLTLSLAEAQQVAAAAEGEGVLVAEAFMYRHHPQIGFLHDLLRRGVLGTPSVCRASLHFVLEDRTGDIRARPELGGGALLDIGCYALDAMRTVFDASPRSAWGTAEFGSTGVDEVVAAVLSYADGRVGLMDVGFRLPWLQAPLQVVGDEGQCTLVNAFNPGSGATEAHVLRRGRRQVVKRFPGFDMWLAMVDAVAATLLDGQPYPYDLAASVETMAALELVRTALGPSGC